MASQDFPVEESGYQRCRADIKQERWAQNSPAFGGLK